LVLDKSENGKYAKVNQSKKNIKPNLFIIGAMKAGTTSLHEYLHQHPEIFMSRFKEPQYFAPHRTRQGQDWGQGNEFPQPGIDWYLKLFEQAGDARFCGESSVSYSARPWMEGCAQRIFEFNADSRIIYLVRDPIERAISHYWHFVRDGREDRPLLKALESETDYIARSDYGMQLSPYLELFGREKVYVLTLENLELNPDSTFRDLFQWLGVDTNASIDIRTRHNVGNPRLRQTRRGLVFVDTSLKHWRSKKVLKKLPVFVRRLIEMPVYRQVSRKNVDSATAEQFLREKLTAKAEIFFGATGLDYHEQWETLFSR
jgi:Sulfotransferase family